MSKKTEPKSQSGRIGKQRPWHIRPSLATSGKEYSELKPETLARRIRNKADRINAVTNALTNKLEFNFEGAKVDGVRCNFNLTQQRWFLNRMSDISVSIRDLYKQVSELSTEMEHAISHLVNIPK